MSIFINKETPVIIQGITGQHATFHAEESMKHGTPVVGGVTPGKGGQTHLDLPVFIRFLMQWLKPAVRSLVSLFHHHLQPMPSWKPLMPAFVSL